MAKHDWRGGGGLDCIVLTAARSASVSVCELYDQQLSQSITDDDITRYKSDDILAEFWGSG